MKENLEIVRTIYAAWETGDFSTAEWADPGIEFAFAGGPEPASWRGLDEMGRAYGEWLSAWRDFRATPEEYMVLDETRVLVLVRNSGRGRTSGLALDEQSVANLFELHGGMVTRLVVYLDRRRAFEDLGLSEKEPSQANVATVRRALVAFSSGDARTFTSLTTPDFEWRTGLGAVEGEIFLGHEGVATYFERLSSAWEEFRFRADQFLAREATVLVLGRLEGRSRGAGVPVDSPVGAVWDVRDGKIWRLRAYLDQNEARAVAGIDEQAPAGGSAG